MPALVQLVFWAKLQQPGAYLIRTMQASRSCRETSHAAKSIAGHSDYCHCIRSPGPGQDFSRCQGNIGGGTELHQQPTAPSGDALSKPASGKCHALYNSMQIINHDGRTGEIACSAEG